MTALALITGAVVGVAIMWIHGRPGTRYRFYQIQQHCAAEGRAQLDDTARVLHVLRDNPDMLKSLLLKEPQK